MLIQDVLQWMSVFAAGIAALWMLKAGAGIKTGGGGMLQEMRWLLEETPALNAFFLFVMHCSFTVQIALSFYRISNTVIISLDILYFLSMLMLILYHTFKEAEILP